MSSKETSTPQRNVRRQGWVLTLLPLNAGVQGFSTMVPLYVLSLGGSVVGFVSVSATAWNSSGNYQAVTVGIRGSL